MRTRLVNLRFESSVNSYGGQTASATLKALTVFESSVNSYGGQTEASLYGECTEFESSVNSYGGQTGCIEEENLGSLRVV